MRTESSNVVPRAVFDVMGIEDEVEIDHTAQIDDDLEVEIVRDEWNKRAGFLTVEAVRGDAAAKTVDVVFGVPFGSERVVRRVCRERVASSPGTADLDLGELLESAGLTYGEVGDLVNKDIDAEWAPETGSDPFELQTSGCSPPEIVGIDESADSPAGFDASIYADIKALSNNITAGFATFASGKEVDDGLVEVTFELPYGDEKFTRRFARERAAAESRYPPLDLLFDSAGVEKTDFEALVMEQFDVEYLGDREWELTDVDYEIETPTTSAKSSGSSSASANRGRTQSLNTDTRSHSADTPTNPVGLLLVAFGFGIGLLSFLGVVGELQATLEAVQTADPQTVRPMAYAVDTFLYSTVGLIGHTIARRGMKMANIET